MIQPGDLLLFRVCPDSPFLDRFIGWAESKIKQVASDGYQYYHVAIVSPDITRMYSSEPPRIDLYPIPNPLPPYIEIYRLKEGATSEGLANVFKYLDTRKGRVYPFLGVLTAGLLQGNLEFCSQLAEDAYCEYPICLWDNIRFATPDNIASSPKLVRVT